MDRDFILYKIQRTRRVRYCHGLLCVVSGNRKTYQRVDVTSDSVLQCGTSAIREQSVGLLHIESPSQIPLGVTSSRARVAPAGVVKSDIGRIDVGYNMHGRTDTDGARRRAREPRI